MQDTGLKNRIFLALFISIIFFIVYDYFFIQPQQTQQISNKKEVVKEKNIEQPSHDIAQQKNIDTKIISVIKSKNFEIHIDSLGRISQYILENNIFNDDKGKKLQILGDKLPKPLEIRFEDKSLNKEAFNSYVTADKSEINLEGKSQTLVLTQNLKDVVIKKHLHFILMDIMM